MTLDELLYHFRERRLVLISEREIWPSPLLTDTIRRGLRRHRKGLRLLIRWSDVRTCCSPTWHRGYWKHAGAQYYTCEVCESLLKEVS
jgi:hypothetical protein